MNYSITSMGESDNVVHCMNTFITSSLAFGCHVGCHRRIFVVGLLFLSTAVMYPRAEIAVTYGTSGFPYGQYGL